MADPKATYQMSFDGNILQRGFWLYIWKIKSQHETYLYVGRTGDSSSPHASSPFNRIGHHLDIRDNAKGNSITRRLKEKEVEPEDCRFSMIAFGPLYDEIEGNDSEAFEVHKPFRDIMATYESQLAAFLKENGYQVLGVHHPKGEIDPTVLEEIKDKALTFLSAD